MKKYISILGSTGSIGLSTINLVEKKIQNFNKPRFFIIEDLKTFKKIKKRFRYSSVNILNGFEAFNSRKKIDITISAIPGIAGLSPTLKLIELSKKILIANKESIICGWNLIHRKAKKNKTLVIPIDSEHYSNLYYCIWRSFFKL